MLSSLAMIEDLYIGRYWLLFPFEKDRDLYNELRGTLNTCLTQNKNRQRSMLLEISKDFRRLVETLHESKCFILLHPLLLDRDPSCTNETYFKWINRCVRTKR